MTRVSLSFLAVLCCCAAFAAQNSQIRSGTKAYYKEKYGEAFDLYRAAAAGSDREKTLEAEFDSAAALYKLKDYDAAAQKYQDIIDGGQENNPYLQSSYFNRANALYMAGKKDEAIASLRKAVFLNENDSQAVHNLQFILLEKKQNDDKQNGHSDKNNDNKQEQDNKESGQDGQGSQDNRQERENLPKDAAERILQMVKENDKNRQNLEQGNINAQPPKTEKDW
jgi:tetratricopeptide (TPR) repeat protein